MNVPGGGRLRGARGRLSAFAVPSDVVAALAFVGIADAVLLSPPFADAVLPPSGAPTPVRAVLWVPLLFFLPGYAVVTALFPARQERAVAEPSLRGSVDGEARAGSRWSTDGGDDVLGPPAGSSVTLSERVAMGFGVSLAVLPIVALALSASGIGFTVEGEVGALSALTVGGVLVGWGRRMTLPAERRFGLPLRGWATSLRERIGRTSPVGAVLAVALVVAGLVAASTLAYALVVPPQDAGYTGLSLLTENDDGELVASGYPARLSPGERSEVVAAVSNREGETVTYTVVAELQRVRTDEDGLQVVESQTMDRRSVTVGSGERETATLAITPEMQGQDLRVVVMLYRGSPPDNPDTTSAYRHTYVWIDVGSDDAGTATGSGEAGG